MAEGYNVALLIGACLSLIAALAHLAVIIGGPSWYRLFGAGEKLARAAEAGQLYPAIITICIAVMLLIWSAYALSGAGLIQPFPLLRPALCLITLIYLLRGIVGPFALTGTGRSSRFVIISSVICLGFGLVHLLGLIQMWERFA
ncbi:hypothetical protein [Phyllobacterium sp. YR531]|uniref:hypothetical protein n=1 Tax=Phyllobacterium sp. YR531 TaxID=1144343 RepID=UPI00026FBB3E|nr:hypothetical protein [Phyllobacterium sp. YR531]EJN02343.1 hypothetical protein PMI41_03095 [Phyllobacterium sp. YR531]